MLYKTVISPSLSLLDKSDPEGSFPTKESALVNYSHADAARGMEKERERQKSVSETGLYGRWWMLRTRPLRSSMEVGFSNRLKTAVYKAHRPEVSD